MSRWVEELAGRDDWLPEPHEWIADERLAVAVACLPPREARVLYLRMALGLSQVDIAAILGIEQPQYGPKTQGRQQLVSRAYLSALRRLKTLLSANTSTR